MSWPLASVLIVSLTSAAQSPASTTAIDAAAVRLGPAATVTELDLGKLKGDLRRLAWSDDGTQFCVQTVDGAPPNEKTHHYLVSASSGAITAVDAAPPWADKYWAMKSDRVSPTDPSVVIDVEQGHETLKYGTGSAGAADGGDRTGGGTVMSSANVDRAALSERRNVVRLTVLGETISEFVDQRPIPGLMFGWGPAGSAILAYTDREGHLMLLDLRRHKQIVAGVRDALLPAWSPDATRLAYVRKIGRKKFALVTSAAQY